MTRPTFCAMKAKRFNKKTGRKEWALVSRKTPSKILEWYGAKEPSDQQIAKSEARVRYYKHGG
jgi:hypothetical protein